MDQQAVISASNISIGYDKGKHSQTLHNNLSFELYSGELVCLLGANGVGKSTLLRTISGSQSTLQGSIYLNGKDIKSQTKKDLSQLLGLVLTDKTSVGGLRVRELVELGRYPYTGFFGQLTTRDKDIVEKAMSDVCIIHKANSYMAELSDGERQKVMIAKALAQECPIVILDEPTAFLDITSRIEITNLLHQLALTQNKAILLSTHDIELALLLADRLWLMSKTHGLQCGVTEDIILSNTMDNFFGNDNIMFNKKTGSFLPKYTSDRKVYLEAENDLYYWAKNLLTRQGFEVIDDRYNVLFSLEIPSPHLITVDINSSKQQLASFDELVKWIKERF